MLQKTVFTLFKKTHCTIAQSRADKCWAVKRAFRSSFTV